MTSMSQPKTVRSKTDPVIGHQHRDPNAGWLRPAVFGMMDGLVSNFALIAGVAGGQLSAPHIVLTGTAGLLAGGLSMAGGEYVSVQSQNESTQREVDYEQYELANNADAELEELTEVYIEHGVDPKTAAIVAAQISQDPEKALLVHSLVELGVNPGNLPSPLVAAGSSVLAFSLGALLPLLPYIFGVTVLWPSAIVATVTLFGVGAFVARFTTRSWRFSGTRQLLVGALSAAVAYGVGALFHVSS